MEKRAYWLSIFAIVISLITIGLFFFKVSPSSIVDSLTFISVLAAFVGISVTLLLGYQIYNALEIKEKLKVVEALQDKLYQNIKDVEYLKLEQEQGFNIIQARLYKDTVGLQITSFIRFLQAIKISLSLDQKEEGYDWMLDELKEYMLKLDAVNFNGGPEQRKLLINGFKEEYKEVDRAIREHSNFFIIRKVYLDYFNKFEKRLSLLEDGKLVSPTELDVEF